MACGLKIYEAGGAYEGDAYKNKRVNVVINRRYNDVTVHGSV